MVMHWREKLGELMESVAYVMGSAPDHFPVEDFLPPDEQMNLDRAFAEIRDQFAEVANGHGECAEIQECRSKIEASYESYRLGDEKEGFLKIQRAYHILMSL
jgi:hypothetical protein